jgi:hypothetical protein
MRADSDFSKGVRGKYAKSFSAGTNLVRLDPDVAAFFPDSNAVNEALRTISELARKQARQRAAGRRKAG